MNKVRLNISHVASETGPLLRDYLVRKGCYDERASAVVCYGQPTNTRPALNGTCAGGKIRNMRALDAAGVAAVPWFQGTAIPLGFRFPALARRAQGHGGTDIVPVFQPDEVPWRIAAGWDWFSSYVPVQNEYRVWTFRDEVLDIYEKVMERPSEYQYVGRNFRNGFEFQHRGQGPIDAGIIGILATRAVGYDFAAVDMLRGIDGRLYVLELNTAPGVLRSKAETTLYKLGDRIISWAEQGYPRRDV